MWTSHTHTHARTNARTHAHARTHARTHVRTHARTHTHTRARKNSHTYKHRHTVQALAHTHARTHTRTHARTHAHTHTHIHTHGQLLIVTPTVRIDSCQNVPDLGPSMTVVDGVRTTVNTSLITPSISSLTLSKDYKYICNLCFEGAKAWFGVEGNWYTQQVPYRGVDLSSL